MVSNIRENSRLRIALDILRGKVAYLGKLYRFLYSRPRVPDVLYMEITNICDANCIFCAHQFDKRKQVVMDDDIFKRAVDEFYEAGGRNIDLSPLTGEVLIDPKILDKIEYLRDMGDMGGKGFEDIHFFTNLGLLHKFDMDRFLRSGITTLYISTAPLDRELYEKMYRNTKYDHVVENLRDLLKAFREAKRKGAGGGGTTIKEIHLEFRSDRGMEGCLAMEDYKEYVGPYLSDGVKLAHMVSYDSWNKTIKEGDLLEGMTLLEPNPVKLLPCARLFLLQVMVSGDIRLCGCRINPASPVDELIIGNINEVTLMEAYNSKRATELGKSFFTGKAPEVCKQCSWYSL